MSEYNPAFIDTANSSFTVYLAGTTVKARNNSTGLLAYAGDNSVDAVPTINNAINNISGAATDGWGGRIHIKRGLYTCTTEVAADIANTTYHGIELVGEGKGTRLNFTPASALTNGILLKVSRPRLANMRIYGNANVTNLIKAVGPGASARYDYGILENLQIDGTIATNGVTGTPTTGQKGLYMDGSVTALYFWKIQNCDFRGLDIGAHLYNNQVTSTSQTNNTFLTCNIGEKISGGQNNLDNIWIQGTTTVGDVGIWLTPEDSGSASRTNINNVQVEMTKTSPTSYSALGAIGVLNDAGTANNRIGMVNASAAAGGTVVSNNPYSNLFFENEYVKRPSASLGAFIGTWLAGAGNTNTPTENADGILRQCIVENPAATFTSSNPTFGTCRVVTTSATINTVRSIYYSNTGATGGSSLWRRLFNPKLSVRFTTVTTSDIRLFIGLWQTFTAPGAGPLTDPLNARSGVGLWLDTTAATNPNNFKVMHNDGTGASTITAFDGTPEAVGQNRVQTIISTDSANGQFTVGVGYDSFNAKTVSTDIPADTANGIGWLISFENTAAASKTLRIFEVEMEGRGAKA